MRNQQHEELSELLVKIKNWFFQCKLFVMQVCVWMCTCVSECVCVWVNVCDCVCVCVNLGVNVSVGALVLA